MNKKIIQKNITKLEELDKNIPINLVLSGGGVKSTGHLALLEKIEALGLKINAIAGSSGGALVASLYASGMSYKQIEKKVLSLKESDITDMTFFGEGGVIQGKKLASWIQETTKEMKIEKTPIKLGIAVSDLTNQEALLITKGDIGEAVQTSSTIPGAFIPVKSNGRLLVDGGVLSLVPVEFTKALGADVILAIDIYCGKIKVQDNGIFNILYLANRVQSCKIAKYEMQKADFIISSKYEPENYGNFDSKEESINAGYEATKLIIDQLKFKITNN